jgi:hypothetical protein
LFGFPGFLFGFPRHPFIIHENVILTFD